MGAARPHTPRWGYYPQTPFLCVDNSKPLQLALIGAAFVLGVQHIESFGRAFSPRRARLRIALPERQYKSFDQTFSKVCGVEGQSPRRPPQRATFPQRSRARGLGCLR